MGELWEILQNYFKYCVFLAYELLMGKGNLNKQKLLRPVRLKKKKYKDFYKKCGSIWMLTALFEVE